MNRLTTVLLAAAVAFAACGTDADVGADGPATSSTAAATTTAATVAETTTTTAATTTTQAETTTTTAAMSEDELAITEAYAVTFSSESSYADVVPFLVEPDGLEGVVEGYAAAGAQVGGIAVEIESIDIVGSDATVIYSLLFAGNPSYSGLTGSAVLTDAGWQISREMFCGLMTSARVGCPDA